MKIIYCIPATYNSGGMERVLAVKANILSKRGHEVYIITTDQCERKPFFRMEAEIQQFDLGINYEETNGSLWKKIMTFSTKQRKHKAKLSELLQKLQADVVISMFGNEASFLPRIKDGSKKVLEYHFSKLKRLQYERKGIWRLIDLWRTKQDEKIVQAYDRFVVLTQEDESLWGKLPNICVIPNPRPFESQIVSTCSYKVAIAAGRYESQKNFSELIRLWARIREQHQDWILRIFGDGSERPELEHLIQELGLTNSVYLETPVPALMMEYAQASIFLMTSRYEGLPMVLIEAQTMGLPIISYACPCGPRDLISSGKDGFLIPYADRETFVEKLSLLMEDDTLRKEMGRNAKEASRYYDPKIITDRWETLLHEVVGINNLC